MSKVLDSVCAGRPVAAAWACYFEYFGSNEANAKGWSDKFWTISHVAGTRTAIVRWGKTGSQGQMQTVSIEQALAKATEKLRKGYTEVASRSYYTLPESIKAKQLDAIMQRMKGAGFPYDQTSSVVSNSEGSVSCYDAEGNLVITLTAKAVLGLCA